MSAISIASDAKTSGCACGYVPNAPPPTSSWPSITILIPTGGLPPQARSAPTCTITFALESDAPRPKIAPSRSVGSHGGELQSDSSPGGTTS